jgi:hypothetical protein
VIRATIQPDADGWSEERFPHFELKDTLEPVFQNEGAMARYAFHLVHAVANPDSVALAPFELCRRRGI